MSTVSDELFKFTSQPDVKQQLAADLAELHGCMEAHLWKASIIFIGSLIECVLYYHIDAVESIKISIPNFDKRNIGLTDLLQLARQHNVIDDNLFRLTEPIRDYRNSIHPRVQMRVSTQISENLVQIGYNVFLEVVRSVNKHRHALDSVSAQAKVTEIVQKVAKREATKADYSIYIPILEKYGISRGMLIIERSLNRGSRDG